MGCYPVGAECCNNCRHWGCTRERRINGNPPKEIYVEDNCAKCNISSRQTLSKSCCEGFAHIIPGIKNTYAVKDNHAPGDYVSAMCDGLDESSRAMMQATIDYIRESSALKCAEQQLEEQDVDEPEADDLDGDAEREFARTMAEVGRANDRALELVNEGMDHRYMLKDKAVEFMHMLDRAKGGSAKDQYLFAKAFIEGSHGAIKDGSYEEGARYFHETLHQSYSLIYYWCKKSAEQGYARAEYLLGTLERDGENAGHNDGAWASKDYLAAMKWFARAARHGYKGADAAYRKTRKLAVGDADGLLIEGVKCLIGMDCDRDISEGLKKVRMASSQVKGDVLLEAVEGDLVKKALSVMERLAKQDQLRVQDVLGMIYAHYPSYKKIAGKDIGKAFILFKSAAEGGDSEAMNHLGYCYAKGEGVEKDLVRAAIWYEKSANGGSLGGQIHYAECLMKGNGMSKDEHKAFGWYMKAAARGSASAQFILCESAQSARGMNEDPALAFEWCKLAANGGNAEAMHKLGCFYGRGYGCMKNASLEAEWKTKAKKNGYESW